MTNIRRYIVFGIGVLGLVIVLSGCVETDVEPRPGSGHVEMNLYTYSNDEFVTNGTVGIELSVEDTVRFENLTACAYDERGRLLTSTNLGTYHMPRTQKNISITTERKPRYVIVDHPGFREFDGLVAGIFHIRNNSLRQTGGNPDEYIQEFEYRPPTEPGECGETAP